MIVIHACMPHTVGIILAYGLAQLVLWVTFHAVSLCWGILFPFHFRRMKADKKLKYIHITTVLSALLLPTIPALLLLKDGYVIIDTPTTFCAGRSAAHTFYALILPLSIMLAIATSAFIIMLWILLKVSHADNFTLALGDYNVFIPIIYACPMHALCMPYSLIMLHLKLKILI